MVVSGDTRHARLILAPSSNLWGQPAPQRLVFGSERLQLAQLML